MSRKARLASALAVLAVAVAGCSTVASQDSTPSAKASPARPPSDTGVVSQPTTIADCRKLLWPSLIREVVGPGYITQLLQRGNCGYSTNEFTVNALVDSTGDLHLEDQQGAFGGMTDRSPCPDLEGAQGEGAPGSDASSMAAFCKVGGTRVGVILHESPSTTTGISQYQQMGVISIVNELTGRGGSNSGEH
jgi:hypothetical protein